MGGSSLPPPPLEADGRCAGLKPRLGLKDVALISTLLLTDLAGFVTLDRTLPLCQPQFLINKVTRLGRVIPRMPKNGAESKVVKGSRPVTD